MNKITLSEGQLKIPDCLLEDIPALQKAIASDVQLMAQLKISDDELAQAVSSTSTGAFESMLEHCDIQEAREEFEWKGLELAENLCAYDLPLSGSKNGQSTRVHFGWEPPPESAKDYELPPETKNGLLYIDCRVNGVHTRAFVDTGCRACLISSRHAKKCGLGALVDFSFSGTLNGMASAKVMGKIAEAGIQIGLGGRAGTGETGKHQEKANSADEVFCAALFVADTNMDHISEMLIGLVD
jgi:hypothetical protein